jgi:pimeloyl-ACP methyl ester carboxylesterase
LDIDVIEFETSETDPGLPWITLVHGFSHHSGYFESAIPELVQRYRIMQIDLRGHGRSSAVAGPFGVEEYVDDLFEVLAALDVEQTSFWGTHTGTAVGLVAASRRPRLFRELVLEGSVLPGFPMPRTDELRAGAARIAKNSGVKAALEYWYDESDWFAYMRANPEPTNADGHRRLLDAFTGGPLLSSLAPRPISDLTRRLNEIDVRALAYNGEFDLPEFHAGAARLVEGLPYAVHASVANAGGFPLWENPAAAIGVVLDFLTTPSDATRG